MLLHLVDGRVNDDVVTVVTFRSVRAQVPRRILIALASIAEALGRAWAAPGPQQG